MDEQPSTDVLLPTDSKRGAVENLRPWQKGQSGNPGGRQKDLFSQALRRELAKPGINGTRLDDVAVRMVTIAIEALPAEAVRAGEYIANRLEGSPRQSVDVTSAEDDPRTMALAALAQALRESNLLPPSQ